MFGGVRTKVIVAGAVVLVVLLFAGVLLTVYRKAPPGITVRHVKSVQSAGITTMTFAIKNHTGNLCVFVPFEVQVRNRSTWTKFQGYDTYPMYPGSPTLGPKGTVSYSVNVANLPPKSVVRFTIRAQKTLLGFKGLVRRVQVNLKKEGPAGGFPLNPYDKNSQVFGFPTEVASDEFVEPAQ
jgi:hypothetical protein